MLKRKTHEEKITELKQKLDIAKKKRKERDLRWKIFKTYLPSFSINKLNLKFTKMSVIISFLVVITYTIFALLLQKYTSIEPSSTLTMSVFGFFGTELVALTTIKNRETKYYNHEVSQIATDDTLEYEE